MTFRRFSLVMAIGAVIVGCADGPSAPVTTAPEAASRARRTKPTPVEPAPAPPTAPSPGSTVIGCGGVAVALSADEASSFALHNQQRAASGLAAFCLHPTLVAAARAHSQDMVANNYMSHTSRDGTTFDVRITRAGYTGWTNVAENIAWGSGTLGTPEATFNWWMNSAGHRANIVNPGLREIGIGVAAGPFQGYMDARVYTADFGTR